MGNLDLYNAFRAVPQGAKKPIEGGRLKGFTDINSMWRIKVLTEKFGPAGFGWYTETVEKWEEPQAGGEVLCFVKINLYICIDGKWSKPIEGTGGSKTVAKERNGLYADDEAYKKATTDAIGSACKLLGVGADVYWSSDRTKYTTAPPEESEEVKNQKMTEEAGSSKIDRNKWSALTGLAKQKGIDWRVILQQESVKNGADLTVMQWKNIMDRLEKMK